MVTNYILYAIPVFFLLIGVELLAARALRLPYYRFNDSINDLSMGITQQVTSVFFRLLSFAPYLFLYQHARLLELSALSVPVWIAGFLIYDLCYYWLHRMSHEINLLWGGHAPHHQSEEYNLAVALRQGAFQGPLTAPFYWPMALLGFPPEVFLVVGQFNTIYQFWIHTRLVGKLGPLEWVLNTPSHHRVHHGKNSQYLDRNHAGMLIIWDKLFGTFVEEQDEPVYGVIDPLRSWNPLWGHFKFFAYLWSAARRSPNRWDLVRIWFKKAGWTPQQGDPVYSLDPSSPSFRQKYDTRISRGMIAYILLHFVLILATAVLYLMHNSKLPLLEVMGLATLILLGMTSLGGLLELRRWALTAEVLRLAASVLAAGWFLGTQGAIGLALLGAVSLLWLWTQRHTLTHAVGEFAGVPALVSP